MRRRDQEREQTQQQAAAQSQYQSQVAQEQATYNRAVAACMGGRGYSAN
jgi:hypothetical protein